MNIGAVHRALKHLHVPRSWRDTVAIAAKTVASPGEQGRRRALARRPAGPQASDAARRLAEQGWLPVTDRFAALAEAAAGRLARAFEELRAGGKLDRPRDGNKAEFFVPVMRNADFLGMAEVMDLVTSRALVDFTGDYFGEVPVLSDICLRWSPVNDSAQSSQLFHRDEEDATQLKFFLHVTDVDDATGPFTVLPAPATARVFAATGRRFGRFTDEQVMESLGDESPQAIVGPRGTLSCIDTARCLHFGSRGNDHERVALFFQYNRFLAPLSPSPDWGPGLDALLPSLDEVQSRLFCRP